MRRWQPPKIDKIPRDAIRNFLLLALMGIFLIIISSAILHRIWLQQQMDAVAAAERESVHLASQALKNHLRAAGQHFQALLGEPVLHDVIERGDPSSVAALARQYAVFMRAYRRFDQIRWIDSTGMERLRLNWCKGRVVITSEKELQNKSDRYYFRRAMTFAPGAIYVSPFDLNIEHGRIEEPPKPVYRIAAPLFDQHGQRRGILIVNLLGSRLFDDIASALGEQAATRLALVNQDGYWLRSPNPDQEWGFMFGRPNTLAYADPTAWEQISSQMLGQSWRNDGLWTWESNRPLLEILSGINQHLSGPVQLFGEERYLWTVLQQNPAIPLLTIKQQDIFVLLTVIAVLLLFSIGLAFMLTRSQFKVERLNAQLARRADLAESESLAKANFLANMSHEIRTPIATILGLTYLLKRSRLSPENMSLVRKIEYSGRSLTRILNDILDLSKIDSGHLRILHEPFALNDVLDNAATLMTLNAANRPIALYIAPPAQPLGRLSGDALRIQQVLNNLVSNAIKFTASGHVGLVVTAYAVPDNQLTLRFIVQDTGLGLSPEQIQKIFTPFRQADESTTRRFGGTGLGLAICQRLVELMNGRIGVNSAPGQGSEFWFELTLRQLCLDDEQASAPRPLERIVVIDDLAPSRAAWQAMAGALDWPLTTLETVAQLSATPIADSQTDSRCEDRVIILDLKCSEAVSLEQARVARSLLSAGRGTLRLILVHGGQDTQGLSPETVEIFDTILPRPVTVTTLRETILGAHAATASPQSDQADANDMSLAGLRVLVVDDNEINQELAAHLLERAGAAVVLAGDGQAALDILFAGTQRIDLVLMDIQMPVMDGHEAIRRIRAEPHLGGLPVIGFTAGTFQDQQNENDASGATLFISKPFDPDDLIRKIRDLASQASGTCGPRAENGTAAGEDRDEEYPGIDVAMGQRLWPDGAKYRKYLRAFVTDYGVLVATLDELRPADIERVTHDIKGVAGNLALPEVAAAAGKINRQCRLGGAETLDCTPLKSAMQTVTESIAQYLAD